MKIPVISGFVGFHGDNVWLDPAGYADDHPLVAARPDLFVDAPEPQKKRLGRPRKAKADAGMDHVKAATPEPSVSPEPKAAVTHEPASADDAEPVVEAVKKSG